MYEGSPASAVSEVRVAPEEATNPELPIGWLFTLAARRLQKQAAESLLKVGLSPSEFICLQLLDGASQPSITELATRAGISRQSIWETIRVLDESGMVTRPRSRYARPATLTARGRRYLHLARRKIAAAEREITAGLNARDLKQLKDSLIFLAWREEGEDAQDPHH
ncbi:putative HTH-type transcriptional regulator MarR [Mycobacteroides abscessus subsp. massiliense]|uniref:MarR family winged helix-turn-helix transcriptional regulator n=2 Tax=Bacteria TaxID=2 RepID=UPI0009D36EDA|nr:putative HTH-type transcriptional regulator MarR [Mycobacteroides abscessus subsp. abscessus]SKF86940.1 putative HTH-type transcriptional regulator MarR [Mycobacteroides abscessus subsp. massiliense]SKG51899.1 putative HTH-type transcriptional regulator MarR [Mycobacteroides abscessus subsp. massiliense]SKI92740.1 putative HTH-type transcriptional regulator MarR [Mycobacteroides abscessus subsp. massiliense]SKJ55693.1 putative HTH-type transcriptional regulator MarR [Mycobacteroides abscessu